MEIKFVKRNQVGSKLVQDEHYFFFFFFLIKIAMSHSPIQYISLNIKCLESLAS